MNRGHRALCSVGGCSSNTSPILSFITVMPFYQPSKWYRLGCNSNVHAKAERHEGSKIIKWVSTRSATNHSIKSNRFVILRTFLLLSFCLLSSFVVDVAGYTRRRDPRIHAAQRRLSCVFWFRFDSVTSLEKRRNTIYSSHYYNRCDCCESAVAFGTRAERGWALSLHNSSSKIESH